MTWDKNVRHVLFYPSLCNSYFGFFFYLSQFLNRPPEVCTGPSLENAREHRRLRKHIDLQALVRYSTVITPSPIIHHRC